MRRQFPWGCLAGATVLAGAVLFAQSWGRAQAPVEEQELLLQVDREFDQATAEKGAEGWASYFAENGSILPGTGAPITGPEAVRAYMASSFARPGFSLRWQPTRAEVWIPGKLGYTLGRWEQKARTPEGKTELLRGTYVTVWRKQPDGRWRIILDTGSADGPPTVVD